MAERVVQAVWETRDPAISAERRKAAIQARACRMPRSGCAPSAGGLTRPTAVQVLQEASQADPLISCAAFVQLIAPTQPADVQLSGLALMQQVVRKRWRALSEAQQGEVAEQVVALAWQHDFLTAGSWPLKSKLAALVSDLIIRRGAAFAEATLRRTIDLVAVGAPHGAPARAARAMLTPSQARTRRRRR